MPQQLILREINCPRCNAIAQVRIEDREQNAIIILWCNKCKLKRNLGLTTRKALRLRKRRNALRKLVSQTKNRRTRAILERRLIELDRAIDKADLGI